MNDYIKLYRGYGCKDTDAVKNLIVKLKTEGDKEINNRQCIRIPIEKQKIGLSKNPNMKAKMIVRTIHYKSVDEIVSDILNLPPDIRRYNDENEIGIIGKCACADFTGARHYATRDTGIGVVLQATIPKKRLFVDGRDFLYTLFREDVVENFNNIDNSLSEALVGAYGEKILQYIEEAPILLKKLETLENYVLISRSEPKIKDREYIFSSMNRYVDYICSDRDIINAHLHSKTLIRGRYNVVFQSAFGIIDGIAVNEVDELLLPDETTTSDYKYEINLWDILQKCSNTI